MTLRAFIRQLEMFMPDLDVPLEVKVGNSDVLYEIFAAGGMTKVTFYIEPMKEEQK